MMTSKTGDNDQLEICNAGDYGSEFEYDSEVDRKRKKRADLVVKQASKRCKIPQKTDVTTEYNKEEGRKDLYHLLSLDAYSRHKKFINDYLLYYGGSASQFQRDTSRDKTDFDVIRENHRFLWDDDDGDDSWGKRLAKKYYDKLFKEYCIADLCRYKENKLALRWRIESEVVSGKGQFICGAKRCDEKDGLRSWEVNFGYVEEGQKKNALVKLRLCPECSHKLNYHHRKKEIKAAKSKTPKVEDDSLCRERQKTNKKLVDAAGDGEVAASEAVESAKNSNDESATTTSTEDSNIWMKPVVITEDKSREEEFDQYFEDMFL